MNKIDKDELYRHLTQFLKTKGIEFHEGTYTERIRQGCSLLTDTINLANQAVKRAKVEVDKTLTQVRQTVHEKTAPKAPPAEPPPPPPPAEAPAPEKTAPQEQPTAQKKPSSPEPKRAKSTAGRRGR